MISDRKNAASKENQVGNNPLTQPTTERFRYFLNKVKLEYPSTQTPSQLLENLLIDYKKRITPQTQGGLFNPTNTYLPLVDRLLDNKMMGLDQKKSLASCLDDKCRVMLETINQYFEKTNLDKNSELSYLLMAFMFYYFPYHHYLSSSLQFLSKPELAMRILLNTDQHIKMLREEDNKRKEDEKKNPVVRFFSTKKTDEKTAVRLILLPAHFYNSVPFLNQDEKLEIYGIAKEKSSGRLMGQIARNLDQEYIESTYRWALNLLNTGSLSKRVEAMDALNPLLDTLSLDQLFPLLTILLNSKELSLTDKKLSQEKSINVKKLLKLISKVISAIPEEKQTPQLKKEIESSFTKAAGKNEKQLFEQPEIILWLPLAEKSRKISLITNHIGNYVNSKNYKSFYTFLNVLENVDRNLQNKAINDIIGHIFYSSNNSLKMRLIEGFYKQHNPFIKLIHNKVVNALLKIDFPDIDKSSIETLFLRSESKDQIRLFNKWCDDVSALPLDKLFKQINKLLEFFIDMTACCDSEELVREGYHKLSNNINRIRVFADTEINRMLDNFEFAISHSIKPIDSVKQIKYYLTNTTDEKKLTQDDFVDAFKNTKNMNDGITFYTYINKSREFGLLDADTIDLFHKKLGVSFLVFKMKHIDILEILLERKKEIASKLNHFKNLALFDEAANLPPSKRNEICQSICSNHLELQLDNDMLMESINLLSKAGIYLRYDQVAHLITTLRSRLSSDSSFRETVLLSDVIYNLFHQKSAELLVASFPQLGGNVAKMISEYTM